MSQNVPPRPGLSLFVITYTLKDKPTCTQLFANIFSIKVKQSIIYFNS